MQKILILLVLVFLAPPVLGTVCCIDTSTTAGCYDTDSGPCIDPPYNKTISTTFCALQNECDLGCCCANPSVAGQEYADLWNEDESGLGMIGYACASLIPSGSYNWQVPGPGESCVDICNTGSTTTPSTGTFTISGHVYNDSTTISLSGATVTIYSTSELTTVTDGLGYYEILNVPQSSALIPITADHLNCHVKLEHVLVDADKTQDLILDCADTISCNAATSTAPAPTLVATVDEGSPSITLGQFSTDTLCGDQIDSYNVIREERDAFNNVVAEDNLPTIPSTMTSYTDMGPGGLGLKPETRYCYRVTALYGSDIIPSDITLRTESCVTTGVEECMNPNVRQWCVNSPTSVLNTCLPDNTIATGGECGTDEVCLANGDGTYGCQAKPLCETCNGLFGMLSSLPLSIFFGTGELLCANAAVQNFCFEDQSLTTVDAYRSCGEVSTCEDYRSSIQCGSNPCAIPSNEASACSWNEVYSEIGLGVCQSTNKPASCGSCESIFGSCNTELCESIGDHGAGVSDCYFDGEPNLLPQRDFGTWSSACLHRDDMACRFYDTREDCLGIPEILPDINVSYSTSNPSERDGGVHTIDTRGTDRFDIGLCKWYDNGLGGICFKDADEHPLPATRDDCNNLLYADYGDDCFRDATPPVTYLNPPPQLLGLHQLAGLTYSVSDNFYPLDKIETRFCINETTNPLCYPTLEFQELAAVISGMSEGEVKDFTIRYYSYDASNNLEIVHNTNVKIKNFGIPFVRSVKLRE